ncbi:MAG: reverse transcriptase domain-containing protein [Paracoccaceae bacterium]
MLPEDARDLTKAEARQIAALMLALGWDAGLMRAAVQVVWADASSDLVERVVQKWTHPYPPGQHALANLIREEAGTRRAPARLTLVLVPSHTEPLPPFQSLALPRLDDPLALAGWLELSPGQLDWFADCQGRLARPDEERFGHYMHSWIPKRSGRRLLEAPRPRLKAIQRRILHEILDLVPTHPDTFGFVRGRNCKGHASRHAGKDVVVTVDLANFFPSVHARRVHAIFRCLGYGHAVARLLTGLCTTRTPADVAMSLPTGERSAFRAKHPPQGAPTSPALANLAAWELDIRLEAFAKRLDAHYSRYADDIALSGDRGLAFDAGAPLLEQIVEIVQDCGFRINPFKTRCMRQGQQQRITGLTVNRHPNIPRRDFDRLKAVLTNCIRHSASSQKRLEHPDFQAHLNGRVAWVEHVNPGRGSKLRVLFDRVTWS